MYRC